MEAAERFTGRVEVYERYRMRFPAAVLDVLRERCGLSPAKLVADVGAGTGMLSELFLAAGNCVIAVEPNAEMRAACERLCATYAGLRVVDAAAEATGLDDASVDLVSVGRAFHWFDQARATAEFRRILKPGGWVVLVSNRRAQDGSDMLREYEDLLRTYGNDYAALHRESRSSEGLRRFGGEDFRVRIAGEQKLTLEEFRGQTQSYSVVPKPGDAGFGAMQTALKEFFARWSAEGLLTLDTECEVVGWRPQSRA